MSLSERRPGYVTHPPKAMSVNRGDLAPIDVGHLGRAVSGVGALIVAMKSCNGDGAKGGRKVDA